MRLFEIESDENAIYFVFINSNPPTFGYKRALATLKELSKNSDHLAFINPAQHGDNYPLPFKTSLKYNKKIFTDTEFHEKENIKNPIQALKMLSKDYSKIYFVTRDHKVKDFRRLHQYAESWGVESFDVIGLGDSKRPLPTATSKDVSINAVIDNDYDVFKGTIPTTNTHVLSNLFIDLRKELIEDSDKDVDTNEAYISLLSLAEYGGSLLKENMSVDRLGNKVIKLENFMDRFKNLKLILDDKFKNVSFGKDRDDNYVLMMNADVEKLRQYIEVNESDIRKSLSLYINESITSGNIATTANVIGEPIKREIDYGFMVDVKKSTSMNKKLDAVNHVLNNYGYIDSDVIQRIEKEL